MLAILNCLRQEAEDWARGSWTEFIGLMSQEAMAGVMREALLMPAFAPDRVLESRLSGGGRL